MAPMAWPARLLWLEPFWVGGLALLVLLPEHLPVPIPYPWLVIGLFFFWPWRWLSGRPLLTGTRMDVFLAFFLLWLPAPLWLSVERAHSWQA
ncbi:MAG: hypothetical protein KDE47_25570, partial [Caldilineaceae bacterium]|nr:hypothetical protein [Caldilineaceae bacterium]